MTKGTVLGAYNKNWGSKVLYSFRLEGDPTFWRCGEEQPKVKKGDVIEFESDAKNNVDVATVKVVAEAPESPALQVEEAPKPESTDDVGERIRYQAARHDATRIVCAALENDHLPHPSNTQKGKRLDLLVGYVETVTKQLLDQEGNN